MTLEEAIVIAKRIEDDDVVGPVGMAIRVLLKEYQEVDRRLDHYEYKLGDWDEKHFD